MTTLTVPVQQKPWCVLPNVLIGNLGNGTTDYKSFWLIVKQVLTNNALFSGLWLDTHGISVAAPTACTVVLSCNSVTAPANQSDTTDRWTTTADIVMASANTFSVHSWIVLGFPGVNASAQLLIDLKTITANPYSTLGCCVEVGAAPIVGNQGGLLFSHDGGYNTAGQYGSTTTRPWCVDELQIYSRRNLASFGAVYLGNLSTTTDWSGKLHAMRTQDGACTRMIFCQAGVPIWFLFLDVPAEPFHTNTSPDHVWNSDNVPWVGACYGSATVVPAGLYNGTPNWMGTTLNFMTRLGSSINPAGAAGKAVTQVFPIGSYSAAFSDYLIAANAAAANAGDGGYLPAPLGIACGVAGYVQPWCGRFSDLYLVGNQLADGSGAEDASSSGYSWRKLGNFMFPWCRTLIQLS